MSLAVFRDRQEKIAKAKKLVIRLIFFVLFLLDISFFNMKYQTMYL